MKFLLFVMLCLSCNAQVREDWVYCMEKGECGIFPVCAFELKYEECTDNETCILEGFVFKIKNGADYEIEVYWDLIGRYETLQQPPKQNTVIPPKSFRYIDSEVSTTHTVRLFMSFKENKSEVIDTATGFFDNKCTKEETCEHLLRLCYFAKPPQDSELADRCEEYDDYCKDIENNTEELECIESCLVTRPLLDPGSQKGGLKTTDLLACLSDVKKGVSKDAVAQDGGAKAWIIVVSILAVMFGMAFVAILWAYCKIRKPDWMESAFERDNTARSLVF